MEMQYLNPQSTSGCPHINVVLSVSTRRFITLTATLTTETLNTQRARSQVRLRAIRVQ